MTLADAILLIFLYVQPPVIGLLLLLATRRGLGVLPYFT